MDAVARACGRQATMPGRTTSKSRCRNGLRFQRTARCASFRGAEITLSRVLWFVAYDRYGPFANAAYRLWRVVRVPSGRRGGNEFSRSAKTTEAVSHSLRQGDTGVRARRRPRRHRPLLWPACPVGRRAARRGGDRYRHCGGADGAGADHSGRPGQCRKIEPGECVGRGGAVCGGTGADHRARH